MKEFYVPQLESWFKCLSPIEQDYAMGRKNVYTVAKYPFSFKSFSHLLLKEKIIVYRDTREMMSRGQGCWNPSHTPNFSPKYIEAFSKDGYFIDANGRKVKPTVSRLNKEKPAMVNLTKLDSIIRKSQSLEELSCNCGLSTESGKLLELLLDVDK